MLVLLDTNVVRDVLLERQPWFQDSRAIWKAHLDGRITAYLTATAITDIFYISRRVTTQQQAWTAVERCLRTFEIVSVDRRMLAHALTLRGRDFEDNLQIACAAISGLDMIITRDDDDFADSPVPVLTPAEVVAQLNLSEQQAAEPPAE